MKNRISIPTILFTLAVFANALFAAEWASDYQSMSAFSKSSGRGSYVKPIATYVGTVLNGSWVASASLPKGFSFDAGMPFQIAFVESGDRNYDYSTAAGTVELPTIFGGKFNGGLGGNEDLHGLSVFTLPHLQLGVGFFHTRIAFRGMYIPSISELQGYRLLSFGIQHSFGHFFVEKLPPALRDFDVSLFFGYNSAYIGYTPDKWTGKLDLDFGTTYTAIIFGYKPIQSVELMLSLGYQTVSMDAGGTPTDPENGPIDANVSIDGRGGFRLGFEVAFSLGDSYRPVVGYNLGANSSIDANIIHFGKSFSEESGGKKDRIEDHVYKESESGEKVEEP